MAKLKRLTSLVTLRQDLTRDRKRLASLLNKLLRNVAPSDLAREGGQLLRAALHCVLAYAEIAQKRHVGGGDRVLLGLDCGDLFHHALGSLIKNSLLEALPL